MVTRVCSSRANRLNAMGESFELGLADRDIAARQVDAALIGYQIDQAGLHDVAIGIIMAQDSHATQFADDGALLHIKQVFAADDGVIFSRSGILHMIDDTIKAAAIPAGGVLVV